MKRKLSNPIIRGKYRVSCQKLLLGLSIQNTPFLVGIFSLIDIKIASLVLKYNKSQVFNGRWMMFVILKRNKLTS